MAQKQLTASVRLNTKQAEQKLRNIARAIDELNKAVGSQNSAYERVNRALRNSEQTTKKVKNETEKWADAQKKLNGYLKTNNSVLNGVWRKVRGIAATYLGIMGGRAVVETTDILAGAQNRLNYVNAKQLGSSGFASDGSYSNKTLNATQESLDKMYSSSQKVRTSYQDMMSNVSRNMTLAGDAFDNNIDYAIRFQEIMSEAYAVGGASAAEMSSSMYQLTQALGSGVLQGDELRSVREGAPLAYKAIEEFAQGVLNTDESLKELAADGWITSEMVVAAVMNMGNEIDNAFAQTTQTFGQTFNQIKNSALYAFQPVMDMLTDMLNRAVDNGMIQKFETFFTNVAKVILIAFRAIEIGIDWIAENWNWLQHIIVGILTLIISYMLLKTGLAITCAIAEFWAWMVANSALLITLATIFVVIAAVLALLYVFYLWRSGAIDTCTAIITALLIVGVAVALIGVLIGSWITFIIGLVFVAVALIIKYLGYVLGAIYIGAAFVWNLFCSLINSLVQFFWTQFAEPWIGIIEWVLNVFNGGFNSFGDAVKNLLGNIISWFLSLGTVVTQIIDAIFGTNWTDGLNGLKDNILKWGKKETAITLDRNAPTILNRWSYSDAWDTGNKHGDIAKDWVNGLGSNLQSPKDDSTKGLGSKLDNLGNLLGLDFSGMGNFPSGSGVGSGYTPDHDKLLKGIGDDTGSIADSMELTNEDLEYLRRVAEMEWKKEFTTAEIKVEMNNANTINGESDLDGIVTKLTDKLYEELSAVADGVY